MPKRSTTKVIDPTELEDVLEAPSAALPAPPDGASGADAPEGEILVHFVTEGFTALGKTWYYGEELRVSPGSRHYARNPDDGTDLERLTDRYGNCWLEYDEPEQIARWGRVCFRRGPFGDTLPPQERPRSEGPRAPKVERALQ